MERYFIDLSLLLVVTAIVSYIFTFLKQPLLVAYILSGVIIGPWGLGLIQEIDFISLTSHLGIIFLLFLVGLVLHPQKLLRLFKEAFWATFIVALFSFFTVFIISLLVGFKIMPSFFIAISLMFSSTVLTVKLLPTTKLHHKRIGAICIGVLILQDIFAVLLLAYISAFQQGESLIFIAFSIVVKVIILLSLAVLAERYIFRNVIIRVERLQELIFVSALAWCFGIGWLGYKMGLSPEIGAFIAGVALARHPISLFISEKLKPLRDFFLLLFFFTLGAKVNLSQIEPVFFLGAFLLAGFYVILKPLYFRKVLEWTKEEKSLAKEAGIRLGQASEFSLLVIFALENSGLISIRIFNFVQIVTVLTLIFSSYIVTYLYPTPVSSREQLLQY